MPETPETSALALGRLIGTVEGLVRSIDEQNKTSAARKKEQDDAATTSRAEFMKVFEGIREDNKTNNEKLEAHIKEDLVYHGAMQEFSIWKKDAEPKVDNLWDTQNKQRGLMAAFGFIGTLIGGGIMAVIQWLHK